MSELLTLAQVAAELGVSLMTLHNWRKAGKLNVLKIGGSVRIRREELERLLAAAENNHGGKKC